MVEENLGSVPYGLIGKSQILFFFRIRNTAKNIFCTYLLEKVLKEFSKNEPMPFYLHICVTFFYKYQHVGFMHYNPTRF